MLDTVSATETSSRTVQQYIDETPTWTDGTPVPTTPMTAMQWLVWWLAAIGKFFEGYVVFTTGVALPLIQKEFGFDPVVGGLVGAAPLAGILVGASALGGAADAYGRKPVFIGEMLLFVAFLVGISLAPNIPVVVACLFGVGLALGADYPTAHMIISESIPSRDRGRLVLAAFGFQALGALFGVGAGYLILVAEPNLTAWRWMYALVALPALLVVFGRLFVPESAHWLMSRDRVDAAQEEMRRLLRREPSYPKAIALRRAGDGTASVHKPRHYAALFAPRIRRATILASVPWLLQDLSTYGIGIFTPTIIASTLGHSTGEANSVAELVHNDIIAAKGAAMIDALLIVGIVFAVLLADRIGRIRLQVIGFVGCAAGLSLAALSSAFPGSSQIFLIFAGFLIFNFMTNLGPNAQTYLIAGEVFPTRLRGKGAGFAASVGKIGAVATAFLFPILLDDIGRTATLLLLVGAALLGAVVTWRFRIDTRGKDLEELHAES
ncbi:MFS transporter [Microbaculum marinum]|uniref:MFS transporter n=1 Tax=Microbaculum marinum TaxID=1764581 RepID=A0AAW9RVJ6_9HYPH